MTDNINQVRKSSLIGEVSAEQATQTALGEAVRAVRVTNNLVNPNNISKEYISIVKKTENHLIEDADKEIKKLERIDRLKTDTDIGYRAKVNATKKQARKATKSVQKRDAYISKNYRKQTIRKDILDKASDKVKVKVNSNLMCVRNELSKTSTGSNLLCLTDIAVDTTRKTVAVGKKVMAPPVKGARLVAKGGGKLIRGGSAVMRNLKINAILNAENPATEIAKNGIMGVATVTANLTSIVMKAVGKGLLKLLMPLIPYIALIFIPFIVIIIGAASVVGSNDETTAGSRNTELTPIAGDVRHRVVERAKSFVGQTGDKIFEYYGMKNHWCCMFVWSCFDMEGAGELFYDGGKTAYCPDIDAWALNNPELIIYYKNNTTGEIIGDPAGGRYGDIALYDYAPFNNNSDHILLIESYNPDTKYYTTIEGNTGGVGNDYSFYTTSRVNIYTTWVSSESAKLHMIIRPDYNSIEKIE